MDVAFVFAKILGGLGFIFLLGVVGFISMLASAAGWEIFSSLFPAFSKNYFSHWEEMGIGFLTILFILSCLYGLGNWLVG